VDEANALPVYNSATGISQTIQEDEELEDSELEAAPVEADTAPKPVIVLEHSKYDPRVPTPTDPPDSVYRIKLVCTLLDAASKSIVTRGNLPRLKGFLTAFQRYLFIKTSLPAEVEFSLLDTLDMLDSRWRQVTKGMSKDEGFPRYSSWLDAHNATVAMEASGLLDDGNNHAKSADVSLEGSIADDDESNSQFDDDNDSMLSGGGRDSDGEHVEGDLVSEEGGTAERSAHSFDEDEGSAASDDDNPMEDDEEVEFDEEAYMQQLEEEAFERELRKITLEALEKGKNVSRKQVAEYMPSGNQLGVHKRKLIEPTPAESLAGPAPPIPSSIFALGGKSGISFQMLKKGNKNKVETRAFVVPEDTNLAQVATRNDDQALRERDVIKQRVLQYEAESANAEYTTGGNVYLEQEKLVKIRNRLSMEEIDKNFGTAGGNLRQPAADKPKTTGPPPTAPPAGRFGAGRRGPGRGGGGGGRGRSSAGGRVLFS
jgi:regulator of nonsense transcripts 2